MNEFLSKDDYEEPCCPLNMHPEVTPIPVGRIMEKLDSYLNKNDYASAERHLQRSHLSGNPSGNRLPGAEA